MCQQRGESLSLNIVVTLTCNKTKNNLAFLYRKYRFLVFIIDVIVPSVIVLVPSSGTFISWDDDNQI